MRNFLRSSSAMAVTEYGLLLALVTILVIGVAMVYSAEIKSWVAAKAVAILPR